MANCIAVVYDDDPLDFKIAPWANAGAVLDARPFLAIHVKHVQGGSTNTVILSPEVMTGFRATGSGLMVAQIDPFSRIGRRYFFDLDGSQRLAIPIPIGATDAVAASFQFQINGLSFIDPDFTARVDAASAVDVGDCA